MVNRRPVRRVQFYVTRLVILVFAIQCFAQDLNLRIPPVKATLNLDGQPITITASGRVTGNQDVFKLSLNADLSDLQNHATDLLRAQLNRSDRCGDRISLDRATLVPSAPAGVLTAYVHYERWVCAKLLGKEVAKKLVGGNGVVPVKLTPEVTGNEIDLKAETGEIQADGSLGEVLRAPAVRDKLRDKITDSIESALREALDLKQTLPPEIERAASIQSLRFADGGSGSLSVELAAEVRILTDQIRALLDHK